MPKLCARHQTFRLNRVSSAGVNDESHCIEDISSSMKQPTGVNHEIPLQQLAQRHPVRRHPCDCTERRSGDDPGSHPVQRPAIHGRNRHRTRRRFACYATRSDAIRQRYEHQWSRTVRAGDEAGIPGENKNDRLCDCWQEYGQIMLNPQSGQAIWHVKVHGDASPGGQGYGHSLSMLRFPLERRVGPSRRACSQAGDRRHAAADGRTCGRARAANGASVGAAVPLDACGTECRSGLVARGGRRPCRLRCGRHQPRRFDRSGGTSREYAVLFGEPAPAAGIGVKSGADRVGLAVQREVLRAGWHVPSPADGTNIWTFTVSRRGGAKTSKLSAVVLADARRWVMEPPPPNPTLQLPTVEAGSAAP